MKAIETKYNGYRFRSRLEARWAVFFDALGIQYQYEPEGFDLNGECYLPDFYLPEFMLYVEIKPIGTERFSTKCARFRDIVDRAILLCIGDPVDALSYDNAPFLYAYDYCDSNGGSSEWKCAFMDCTDGNVVLALRVDTRRDRKIYLSSTCLESDKVGALHQFVSDKLSKERFTRIDDCAYKARQARFEYGENG